MLPIYATTTTSSRSHFVCAAAVRLFPVSFFCFLYDWNLLRLWVWANVPPNPPLSSHFAPLSPIVDQVTHAASQPPTRPRELSLRPCDDWSCGNYTSCSPSPFPWSLPLHYAAPALIIPPLVFPYPHFLYPQPNVQPILREERCCNAVMRAVMGPNRDDSVVRTPHYSSSRVSP